MRPTTTLAALALVSLAFASSPAAAQEARWTLRGFAHWLDSAEESVVVPGGAAGGEAVFSTSSGSGFGFDVEYRLGRRLGLGLTGLIGDLDTELAVGGPGPGTMVGEDFDLEMLLLDLAYHFRPDARADVYAGPVVGMVYGGDVVYELDRGDTATLRFDDDFGFGLQAGIDVRIREDGPWIVSAAVRWVKAILENEVPGGDLDLDPLVGSVGFGYRF